jgi:hypothetical protein
MFCGLWLTSIYPLVEKDRLLIKEGDTLIPEAPETRFKFHASIRVRFVADTQKASNNLLPLKHFL